MPETPKPKRVYRRALTPQEAVDQATLARWPKPAALVEQATALLVELRREWPHLALKPEPAEDEP